MQEEVDVGGWEGSAVKVFAKGPPGSLFGIGNG